MPNIYHDRKMLKWLPFEALEAQSDYLKALYHDLEKVDKPTLSPDQYASMQYTLETALRERAIVEVKVFMKNSINKFVGEIVGLDATQGVIYLKNQALLAKDIIGLKML